MRMVAENVVLRIAAEVSPTDTECAATDGGADLFSGGDGPLDGADDRSGSHDQSAVAPAEMADDASLRVAAATPLADEFRSMTG
jgi:hypothetical protein